MSDTAPQPTEAAPPTASRSFGDWLRDMPRWKKIALGASILAVAAGGVWTLAVGGQTPESAGAGSTASGLSASLIETQPGQNGGSSVSAAPEPASKGVFRLGFSFLAGFCIGAFLRAVLKLAAIAVGFWLVMTFLLSYAGIVEVNWQAMDDLWNTFVGNIEREWGSFQSFMLGSLPATGLATTGLVVGLKRH
ncbi:MAG TPA: hypothetical protein ENI87_06675 [bacterium]|nr:hypothetical protein [bacterium]